MTQLVIPQPEAFAALGLRVTPRTPLARVVAVLRQHNPRASYVEVRRAAEQLRLGRGRVEGNDAPAPEPTAEPSESGPRGEKTRVLIDESTKTRVAPEMPQRDAATEPTRAEVAAWVATQRGLSMARGGRIPKHIMQAYREAHRDEMVASMVPVVNADGSPAEPMPAEPPVREPY